MKEEPRHSGFRRLSVFIFLTTFSTALWASTAAYCPQRLAKKVHGGAVLVVDAMSSGALIAPELVKRGFTPIHVQSSLFMDPALLHSMHLEDFKDENRLLFNGDLTALLKQLRGLDIQAVIPGCETGVLLADRLSEALGLLTNGTALSLARRDKYEMIEACRRAGLPVAMQFLARDRGAEATRGPRSRRANPDVGSVYGTEEGDFEGILELGSLLQLKSALGERSDTPWMQEYLSGDYTYQVKLKRTASELAVVGVERRHRQSGETTMRWAHQVKFFHIAQTIIDAANLRYADMLENLPLVGFPVIIKPRDAAAGFGVAKETTHLGALLAMGRLLGTVNPVTNEPITDVLVQEYLDGKDEYVVDLAMMDGEEFYVTDVSLYNKIPYNGAPSIYESEELVAVSEAERLGLVAYARRVVEALNIRYGAAHMEIKMTSRGPRLVEVGARLSGGGFPVLVKEVTGEDPVDALLDAYLDPDAFRARMQRPHRLVPSAIVYLMSPRGGRIRALPYLEELRQLPSFFRDKMNVAAGEEMSPTSNFLDYPGQIELRNENPEQLAIDRAKAREISLRPYFFVMETDYPPANDGPPN